MHATERAAATARIEQAMRCDPDLECPRCGSPLRRGWGLTEHGPLCNYCIEDDANDAMGADAGNTWALHDEALNAANNPEATVDT